jgi:hypothetical protein
MLESLNVEEVLDDGGQALALLHHRGQHVLALRLGVVVLGKQAGVGDQARGRRGKLVADHGHQLIFGSHQFALGGQVVQEDAHRSVSADGEALHEQMALGRSFEHHLVARPLGERRTEGLPHRLRVLQEGAQKR